MIAEAFLICALSPTPAMAFAHPGFTGGAVTAHHAVVASAEFILRRHTDLEKRMLVVGGDPAFVRVFRGLGFKAFGALTDDWPGVSPWHTVTDVDKLSFQSGAFHAVYVLQRNPLTETAYDALKESVRMVSPAGYLIFNEDDYPDWSPMMRFWNWERMAVVFNGYAVWKRPVQHDGFSYAYKNTVSKMGKNVIPFKQLWAMRQMLASA